MSADQTRDAARAPRTVHAAAAARPRYAVGAPYTPVAAGAAQTRAGSGTALLSGTLVTDAPTPEPVRRAIVRLGGAPGTSVRVASTDDAGRFVFAELPAGSFTLSASKPGYVTAFHGSTRPGQGPGVPVAVGDGQRVSVTLRIARGAVITGTITDTRGNPAPMVPVTAVEIRPAGASPAPPARATTDDRGVYRVYGLAPGDYVVSALPRLGFNYGRGGTGVTADIIGVTDDEVRWGRAATGSGAVAGAASMPSPGRAVTYAPVFYPGTTNAAATAILTVLAGEERANVGFALQVVPTARIAGTLVDHLGQPVGVAAVTLHPRRSALPSVADALAASGAIVLPRASLTGSEFSFAGVMPGEYTVVARTGWSGRGAAAAAASASAPPTLWNFTDVAIDGQDRTDLVLRLQPGSSITGSVVFDGSALAPPDDRSRIEILLTAVHSLAGAPAAPRAVVDRDGRFRFASVVPGTYALTATSPLPDGPARWTLKSAMLNGRDLADVLLEVVPGQDAGGVVITFVDRAAEIAGRLVDAGGRPVTRYSIVVFTVDRPLWLPRSRRVQSVRPATDGSFRVAGLPAGEYAIAAVEDLEDARLSDPAFLGALLGSAYRVSLGEAETRIQDLRIGR